MVHWAISAISLVVVAYLIPGIRVEGIGPTLIAPLVIGLVNATVGFIIKIVTFPVTILSLGIFLLVINALMLRTVRRQIPRHHENHEGHEGFDISTSELRALRVLRGEYRLLFLGCGYRMPTASRQ